ncbi:MULTISPECIES: ribosomal protection-like ABC-F family protein [Clostridia]|uniref:ABC-F family ATP-binding cassette domain-containing protein n=2 Tax=Blautia TaxID=572511 RepID=A0A8I0AGH4_9FIRM|nr:MULTISPECIES: ABC-F family ATP-binding cassette domain-containing protein [Clostridia]HCL09511.1 ABC transporter [Blautia sp.]MBC5652693.1 ABC-F family ATP-binding cassette domain-containing protein [Blautia segnis]MCU6774437.1 ABC-F family ATP-binding cassette domain-containing protein [Blautia acetigignens]NSL04887.1 ABC-F family ATP-binding cassette domain-containing protein [Blautia glucerasea]RGF76851.1 ABC transporter ATP-binding protein [Ruminococcus sp. AF31-8BH]
MILSCQSICKSFGEKVILQDASFHIEEREKAALIGNNGAGKTTLLRIIMQEISADSGNVVIAKDKKIGYLAQYQDIHGHHTIYEELLTTKQYILDMEEKIRTLEQEMKYVAGEKLESLMNSYTRLTHQFELENGYAYKSEIVGVLKGLGFEEEDYSKQIENLSGGQKTRVALGKLLISKPDILLLDEPTNHLDMESIAWLETYLLNYPGAVFIVSHDRYFLDKVVTKIVEIEAGQMRMYDGNYSAYALKKAMLRDAQYKAYLNQQREIKHQEAVITKLRSFNREKSIKRAESRVKMLDKIQRIEKPVEIDNQMRISLEPRFISGNDVLTVEGLSKAFPGQILFTDISFEIKRGERVALIGNNGTGKTTILKILNGIVEADAGRFALGSKVQIGYYDQEHHVLHMEKTIFQEISDTYPTLTETEIRNMLAAFLFTGDDVFKLISSLSGGERGRVSLAKLMLSEANFLILDEPTNHLDIASKEILEEALNSYTGTVLYVSHDRYFINQTATRIMDLTNQAIVNYIGDYDYYLEKKDEMTQIYAPAQETAAQEIKEAVSETKLTWQQQKEEQALKRKRENELKKVEARIEELETRDKEIDETMVLPDVCTNVAECTKLSREKAAIAEELEGLYERWEELA